MKVLAIAAIAEAATGLALLVVPSLVGQLLLDAELSGVSVVIGRVTGIAYEDVMREAERRLAP